MTPFEYALALFSVMIGLALADIAMSLHKLVRHCRTLRWDGRVILSSLLVVVVVVRMWFAFWSIRDDSTVLIFPFYLSLFIELMILFLLAASCLPDDPPADCDLGAFYETNQRTLWTVFALFQTSYFLHWLYFGGLFAAPLQWVGALLPLAFYALLIFIRRPRVHYAIPAALIAWELWFRWSLSLN